MPGTTYNQVASNKVRHLSRNNNWLTGAMKDYGMGFYDAERWAWLNTLIGYDIGADRAKGIIEWHEEQDLDVFDLTADDGGTLNNICSFELGYHIRFDAWAQEASEAISFSWPDRPKVLA